jgi:Holliday junction resolvase RusA-like endonuclease
VTFTLTVLGKPVGKGRPRFSKQTGHARTPHETMLAENEIRAEWIRAGMPTVDGPIMVDVELRVRRPASHWKKNGALSAEGERCPWPHRKKPDLDNAFKLVADALNGRAWPDDVQIVRATMLRDWTLGQERTVITAQEMTA